MRQRKDCIGYPSERDILTLLVIRLEVPSSKVRMNAQGKGLPPVIGHQAADREHRWRIRDSDDSLAW